MGTRALDLVTIGVALMKLEEKVIAETKANSVQWKTKLGKLSPETEFVLKLLTEKNRKLLAKLKDFDVKVSFDADELNEMMKSAGFSENIGNLGSREMGFVSILDKLTKWLEVADECWIQTKRGEKPGFRLHSDEVDIYEVEGFKNSILVSPLSKTENRIWFFLHKDNGIEGIKMAKLAFNVMSRERWYHPEYEGARIPKIDFKVEPNIKWLTQLMLDPDTKDINDVFLLNEAKQIFKMRMDETGARVKVVTFGSGLIGAAGHHKYLLIIDRPFYGWWTQGDLGKLPMACFYADYDSWKEPKGSLEEL